MQHTGNQQGTSYYNPDDLAKITLNQLSNYNNHINPIGNKQGTSYYNPDDLAKTTLTQLSNYNNHINPVGNQSINLANANDATHWEAPITMKDLVKNINYLGSAGFNQDHTAELQNYNTNTIKEKISKLPNPTPSNYNKIPDINSLGDTYLKEQINIDRFNPANQYGYNASRPQFNQENKVKPSIGDNINRNMYDTLSTNQLYNNIIGSVELNLEKHNKNALQNSELESYLCKLGIN